MDVALLLLAKAPETAKSRLAAAIGRDGATRIAAALLDDALARGEASASRFRALCWEGPPGHPAVTRAREGGWTCRAQARGDLGARMHAALDEGLRRAPRALLMGSDCPGLAAPLLDRAAGLLGAADIVLVPARDGGYVLIGATRRARADLPALFSGIDWGGAGVAAATRARAAACGLSVTPMDALQDLDDADDLAVLAARHPFLAAAARPA